MRVRSLLTVVFTIFCGAATSSGQPYGRADHDQPGDAMIQAYLARVAAELHDTSRGDVKSAADWERLRPRFKHEYLDMLGLGSVPRTPLHATVTGTLEGAGFRVEKLHYQSVPGLYVTGNLYRPAETEPGARLPAVFYVCGHSGMGRDGNKTAFQSHGVWLARHGYVCLIVDTLEAGEIAGNHHGTSRSGLWWWQSRGYTPAGVECWNGIRGIDYLLDRPDVDPDRIAVTGISGGGAATFWIAAADERVKVAVPVSGMADLPAYVTNRVVNGHCDCMFLYNTYLWPWTRIAGMVAPRPLLFVNSDQDAIFPMDANERISNHLERIYSLFESGDRVDAVVSVGGHAYRRDILQAAYRFLNAHLKNDPRPVGDAAVDFVPESGQNRRFVIAPERLRVFPDDTDFPADRRNATIDRDFVPLAQVPPPAAGQFDAWKDRLLAELRRVTFRTLPEPITPAREVDPAPSRPIRLETEPGIIVPLSRLAGTATAPETRRVVLIVAEAGAEGKESPWWQGEQRSGDAVYLLEPRGVGPTRWTRKNPLPYVERALPLLGRTVDGGRVWDIAAVARYLRGRLVRDVPLVVAGERGAGILAAYAALVEPDISAILLVDPPSSHMDADAPALLNVLRVLDIPEALGMLAPRPLSLRGEAAALGERVATIYLRANAPDKLDRR